MASCRVADQHFGYYHELLTRVIWFGVARVCGVLRIPSKINSSTVRPHLGTHMLETAQNKSEVFGHFGGGERIVAYAVLTWLKLRLKLYSTIFSIVTSSVP